MRRSGVCRRGPHRRAARNELPPVAGALSGPDREPEQVRRAADEDAGERHLEPRRPGAAQREQRLRGADREMGDERDRRPRRSRRRCRTGRRTGAPGSSLRAPSRCRRRAPPRSGRRVRRRRRRAPRSRSPRTASRGPRAIRSTSTSASVAGEPLELVEERELLLLLLGVRERPPRARAQVRRRDLGGRALGEIGAGRHRERRADRAEQARRSAPVRAAGRAREPGDEAEHRGEAVVGAVDRARDPAARAAVPALAAEDPSEPHRGHVVAAPSAGRACGTPPARSAASASVCCSSSSRISSSSRSVSASPVGRSSISAAIVRSIASWRASSRSTGATRACSRRHARDPRRSARRGSRCRARACASRDASGATSRSRPAAGAPRPGADPIRAARSAHRRSSPGPRRSRLRSAAPRRRTRPPPLTAPRGARRVGPCASPGIGIATDPNDRRGAGGGQLDALEPDLAGRRGRGAAPVGADATAPPAPRASQDVAPPRPRVPGHERAREAIRMAQRLRPPAAVDEPRAGEVRALGPEILRDLRADQPRRGRRAVAAADGVRPADVEVARLVRRRRGSRAPTRSAPGRWCCSRPRASARRPSRISGAAWSEDSRQQRVGLGRAVRGEVADQPAVATAAAPLRTPYAALARRVVGAGGREGAVDRREPDAEAVDHRRDQHGGDGERRAPSPRGRRSSGIASRPTAHTSTSGIRHHSGSS